MRKIWYFFAGFLVVLFLFFLFKRSDCWVGYVTKNGLEEMVFGGILEKTIYSKNGIKISLVGNGCTNHNLLIKKINFPFIVTVEKKEMGSLRRIHTIYQFTDLNDLIPGWYGKKVEIYVYNKIIDSSSLPKEMLDSLNISQKQNWFILGILRSKFLGGSVLGKTIINFFDIYPVVGIKVYD